MLTLMKRRVAGKWLLRSFLLSCVLATFYFSTAVVMSPEEPDHYLILRSGLFDPNPPAWADRENWTILAWGSHEIDHWSIWWLDAYDLGLLLLPLLWVACAILGAFMLISFVGEKIKNRKQNVHSL